MTGGAGALRIGGLGPSALLPAYRAGGLDPVSVVAEVFDRIESRGDDGVWIELAPRGEVMAAAIALADADRELPLYGVPFSIKDNIDVAGMPTTAACPDFAYRAAASAPVVDRLLAAGALLIGKTNLDQFATGLNGTRSPYGAPASACDPTLISGGSSSGSAVSVAAGLVGFSIGTDTAGSGRVPAALNGVVGLKPSIGLVSNQGTVPACRSLDCPSVFAGSVAEAAAVLAVIAGFDAGDPQSRRLPAPPSSPVPISMAGLRLAIPARIPRWGGRGEEAAWSALLERLAAAGAALTPIDPEPWWEAGAQLYQGPWVAERLAGLERFVADRPQSLLPVILEILHEGRDVTGVEVFAGIRRIAELRRHAERELAAVDALLTPTVTETFTIEQMRANPILLNSRLGAFTTFTNLLDLCAAAVPAGGAPTAPFGVSIQAPAGCDGRVAAIAAEVERLAAAPAAPAQALVEAEDATESAEVAGALEIAVVGAHLSGMPLHSELADRGAVLTTRARTAPEYRLHALAGGPPARPGLRRVAHGGASIEVEVYRLPSARVGDFLATIPAPLGLGRIRLEDGAEVIGFVCEPIGFDGARDVSDFGGWRAFLASPDGAV